MKALRAKRLKKLLLYYKVHYGIEAPFRVIVDGSFMLYALEKKLYFREQLPKVLQARAVPMVTKCIVSELRKNPDDPFGAGLMAKRLEHVACGHDEHPVSPSECIKSVLAAQPKTFLIATQNSDLQKTLERIPGVPTLFFFNNVLTIVKPSNFERMIAGIVDRRKGHADPEEMELARQTSKQLREIDLEKQRSIEYLMRNVKPKAKGPNPLSVLKPKKSKQAPVTKPKEKKKRKRNRTRSGDKKHRPEETDAAQVQMDVTDMLVDATPAAETATEEEPKKEKKKRHRKRKRTRGGVKRRKLNGGDMIALESADEVDSSFSGDSSDDSSSESDSDLSSESSASSAAE